MSAPLISDDLQDYIDAHLPPEPELLRTLTAETERDFNMPFMISSRHQGQFVQMVTSILQPERILEIGTFT